MWGRKRKKGKNISPLFDDGRWETPSWFFFFDEQTTIGLGIMQTLFLVPYLQLSSQAHFKHLVASCASLHSSPQTLAPHFRHLIVPQYPQLSQNCLCGGPPAGGGAEKLCEYGSGGALSKASRVAGFSGGGNRPDTSSNASSEAASMSMREGCAVGAGVASVELGGIVLCLSSDCAFRTFVVSLRSGRACCCCASWASSSSSQCLICRWYCIIFLAFCVFGTEGFPGIEMLCFGSLSLSSSAMRRAIAVCWRAESSFSPRWPLGAAAARFLFLGLMATFEGS